MVVVRKFFKTGRSNQRKCSSWWRAVSEQKLAVDEHVESGDAVPCLMFYSPFHIFSALLIGYCKSDPCSHCVLALVQLSISPRPLQTCVLLEQHASYRGSRWILSRRQHVPNKQLMPCIEHLLGTLLVSFWFGPSLFV